MRLFNLVTNHTWGRALPMLHIPLNMHLASKHFASMVGHDPSLSGLSQGSSATTPATRQRKDFFLPFPYIQLLNLS